MEIKYTTVSVKRRILAITLTVALIMSALLIRLMTLQIFNGASLQNKGLSQWLRDLSLTANRGTITDRNGVALASSYTTYDCYIRESDIKDEHAVINVLSTNLGIEYSQIKEKLDKYNYSELLIEKQIEKNVVQKILNNYQSGIFFTATTSRNYEYDQLLCQILGLVSADGSGQSGLELYYNTYLKGINGVSLVESDLKGTTLNDSLVYYIDSIDGLNLQLTIDFQIQSEVEKIMQTAMVNTAAKSVSALVMEPNTGEILSICTLPSYNLNEVDRTNIELLNKLSRATVIADTYEPGSTFKIIVAAIALQEGLTSRNHCYYCGGFRIINGVRINCSRRSGHGSQSLLNGLKNSCNCVFMDLVAKIGLNKFYWYLDQLGFTSAYGLDYPGETSAVLMPQSLVTAADLARMGFGQTIAISALQLVNATCSIINGGTLMQPHLVKAMYKPNGEEMYKKLPTALNKVFDEHVTTSINEMLLDVVSTGGGKYARIDGYNIAGKTGVLPTYYDIEIKHISKDMCFLLFYNLF